MVKILLIFIFSTFLLIPVKGQTITIDDLIALSSIPLKNTDSYLNRKGFVAPHKIIPNDPSPLTFNEIKKRKSKDTSSIYRSISLYKKAELEYYELHTSSEKEYNEGKRRLTMTGFLSDSTNKINSSTILFLKNNIRIIAKSESQNGIDQYSFVLEKKPILKPNAVEYAEDLLKFDSHEYLLSVFGPQNVKQDIYYFTEKELKKCSVLFPNSSMQVIFIWNNETTLSKLSYLLISGILPTLKAIQYNSSISQNKWTLRNGIYSNMSIRELMEVNGEDFEFYGRNSEFSYMIEPKSTGKIDFKKIGVTLGCFDCSSPLLEKTKIKASSAIASTLGLYVVYIMIMP
ncbi:MAG: hypothetical protein ABIU11_06105 [Chitinophagaceae bacterium]